MGCCCCCCAKPKNNALDPKDVELMFDTENPHIISKTFDVARYKCFSFKGLVTIAKASDVYDGDTLSLSWKQGNTIIKWRCRCLGYDSPEMKPRLNAPNRAKIIENAQIARNKLVSFMGKDMMVLAEMGDFDKYGRILVTLKHPKNNTNINEQMIAGGYGVKYNGGTKDQGNGST